MASPNSSNDIPVVLALFGLLLFASPLTEWWANAQLPWYSVYLIWALLILLTAFAAHRRRPKNNAAGDTE